MPAPEKAAGMKVAHTARRKPASAISISTSIFMCANCDDRARSEHFQNKLHRHQHGIVAARQPALGEAAGVVDEYDVELRLKHAACTRNDHARPHRQLSREGFDD